MEDSAELALEQPVEGNVCRYAWIFTAVCSWVGRAGIRPLQGKIRAYRLPRRFFENLPRGGVRRYEIEWYRAV